MKNEIYKYGLAILTSIAAVSTTSYADVYVPTVGGNGTFNWTVDDGAGNYTGWRVGSTAQTDLPGTGDTVIINSGRKAQVTTDVSALTDANPSEIRANNTNGNGTQGTIEILSGGTLTTTLARSNSGSDRGNLIVSGTGTLNADLLRIEDSGFLFVDGHQASVNLGAFNAEATGTLDFDFSSNALGIKAITTSGAFTITTGSFLDIDLTDFTPATGTFDLVTFDSRVGSYDLSDITITGLGGGLTASVAYDTNSMNLVIVPEPGTFALLAGLTGLAFVMLRRR